MKRFISKFLNSKGITVLELLVAIAILSFVIVGGFTVISQGFKLSSNTQEKTDVRYTQRLALDTISKDNEKYVGSCIVYDGNKTSWPDIKKELGFTGVIPTNTTILIKGEVTVPNKEVIEGVNKESVNIYITGGLKLESSAQIKGTKVYVQGQFNLKNQTKIHDSAEVHYYGSLKADGEQSGKIEGLEFAYKLDSFEEPICYNKNKNDNDNDEDNDEDPPPPPCKKIDPYTFNKLPKVGNTENYNNIKMAEGQLSIALRRVNDDEYNVLINANNYSNNRLLIMYIELTDGSFIQIPKSSGTSSQYKLNNFKGTPKEIYICNKEPGLCDTSNRKIENQRPCVINKTWTQNGKFTINNSEVYVYGDFRLNGGGSFTITDSILKVFGHIEFSGNSGKNSTLKNSTIYKCQADGSCTEYKLK